MPLPLWEIANKTAQTQAAFPVSPITDTKMPPVLVGHYLEVHRLKLEASLSPVQP